MVERLILHIGTHKTGSSSIQSSLEGYDDGTRFYARFNTPNHSDPMYTAFAEAPETYAVWRRHGLSLAEVREKRARYRTQFEADLTRNDRETLVISGESMSRLDPSGKTELIETARRHVRDIQVICYVRAPVSFAASAFQERVKNGIKNIPGRISPRYRNCLHLFGELLGSEHIRVRHFDRKHLLGGSVVQDFCAQSGLDPDRITESSRNESVSAAAVKILYTFNRTNPCYFGERALVLARRRMINTLQAMYAGSAPVDPARFVAHADQSDLPYLEETFGIHFDTPPAGETTEPLESWLLDYSDIDLAPLVDKVSARGKNADNVDWLASRLYYTHLAETVPT